MPHGAGSGFRNERLPQGTQGVFFGVRVLLGPRLEPSAADERAWRYVDLADSDEALTDELEILRRIRCNDGTPRELPDDAAESLYSLWERTQAAILREYDQRLDPATAGTRIPASQSWAIDLLAGEAGALWERGVRASVLRDAASALSVPRGPLVLRQLATQRRLLKAADLTRAAAALGVLETVEREGLRPIDHDETARMPDLTRERIRLICYQVVHR
jgi:hypothetical protein